MASTLIEKAEFIARSRLDTHDDPLVLCLVVKYFLLKKDLPKASEEIIEEILNLYPYQFSKQRALRFISENLGLEKEFSCQSDGYNSISPSWVEIVSGEEGEILYALLKFMQAITRGK